jgi:hypothetical protein
MPRGASPGERRGGREKGVPNKATAEKRAGVEAALAVAFAALGPERIDQLSPAQLQLIAMREAAKAGYVQAALAVAKEAAPYFDAKLASKISAEDGSDTPELKITIVGGFKDEPTSDDGEPEEH